MGKHILGAQKHPPGKGWLVADLVKIIPGKGEVVRGPP